MPEPTIPRPDSQTPATTDPTARQRTRARPIATNCASTPLAARAGATPGMCSTNGTMRCSMLYRPSWVACRSAGEPDTGELVCRDQNANAALTSHPHVLDCSAVSSNPHRSICCFAP